MKSLSDLFLLFSGHPRQERVPQCQGLSLVSGGLVSVARFAPNWAVTALELCQLIISIQ